MYDGVGGEFDAVDAHVLGLDGNEDYSSGGGNGGGPTGGCTGGCTDSCCLSSLLILLGFFALGLLGLVFFFGWLFLVSIF